MSTGSRLVAGSRVGERSGGAASGADAFARSYRRAALAGSAATLWGLVALLASTLRGVGAFPLLAGGLALAGVALVLLAADAMGQRRGALFATACALLGLAFAFAAAGHVIGPNGALVAPLFLLPDGAGWLLPALALLAAPLVAGWRSRALDLALRATGRRPRFLPLRALLHEDPDELVAPLRVAPGPLARGVAFAWLEGLRLPGLVALDLWHAAASRLRPGHAERVHLDADLPALQKAFSSAGAAVEARSRSLSVQLPGRDERVRVEGAAPEIGRGNRRVRVRRQKLAYPRGAWLVEIDGPRGAAHEARRLLETDLSHAGRFAWTAQGRRWEARLNALLRDAMAAQSLEERSALLEEANRLEALLDARDLMGDERQLLRGWKAQRLRILLSNKLLSEPVGPRSERTLAPAPALAPALEQILDAGGLATLRRLVFVPHWVVPVRTRWGEQEVLVNALTHKVDLAAGVEVLDAARERGAALFVTAPRGVQFLQAPEPNASILRAIREAGVPGEASYQIGAPMEILYVPFVPAADGYANAVTGEAAKDMGPAPAMAARA